MLINDKEKRTCAKYSKYDNGGKVHCYECPLRKNSLGEYDFRCKANSHYEPRTREWEYDEGIFAE